MIKRAKIGIVVALILAAAGVIYYPMSIFLSAEKPVFFPEIKTAKNSYVRGEEIGFTITNGGSDPIWYLVPPLRCKSDFHWSVVFSSDEQSVDAKKYPPCEITDKDYDYTDIKKLNPGSSINAKWDQRMLHSDEQAYHAGPGKYKIIFFYATDTVDKTGIGKDWSLLEKKTYSEEFEINDDFFDNYVESQIREENDAARKEDLLRIKEIIEKNYGGEKGKYPLSYGLVKLNDKLSNVYDLIMHNIGKEKILDPKHPEYYYGYISDGNSFELSARFENMDDNDCEIVGESLCIYRIDSSGRESKKMHVKKKILTITEPVDAFLEKSGMFGDPEGVLVITSEIVGEAESGLIRERNIPASVKIINAREVKSEDLAGHNLVLVGNPGSNSVMKDVYKMSSVADIADSIDLKKNNLRAAFGFAVNPWNMDKKILIADLGYSFSGLERIKGTVRFEKIGEYYRIGFTAEDSDSFALVQSFDMDSSLISNLNDFDGKKAEIYGYKRAADSIEFPIEESLGVIDISFLDY